jgi:uroporphyrin-III C-methyltransferase
MNEILHGQNRPGVLVKTCNRLEFYEGDGEVPGPIARHLFRVVSGLDSGLIGETAIQGQIKAAYLEACVTYTLSKGIHQLFQTALSVGKRVRCESGISRGAMSHSQAAVEVITKSGIDLNNTIISLIGAHKLNDDIIRFLKNKGAETIFLANKSFEKAESLAKIHACKVMRLDQLPDMLQFSDILISATAAPHLIVNYDDFPKNRKMLILDLAFPHDVDELIGKLPGVTLFNLENIENMVNQNKDKRRSEVLIAEEIIEAEIDFFLKNQSRQCLFHETHKTGFRVVLNTNDLILNQIANLFSHFPEIKYEVLPIKTNEFLGNQNTPLNDKTQKFFNNALGYVLNNDADLAIYPEKDLPYPLPAGIEVIALIDVRDETDSFVSESQQNLKQKLALVSKNNHKIKKMFQKVDIRSGYGNVWLVGFGPGDPDLLTVKGLELLKTADIIFYDDLLNHSFLDKFHAEKVYVGKRKNKHSIEQEEINHLLYMAAISGKQVVRLKGGDPMIFAHGGEEIEYLRRRLVVVNVVPGVTSALAASAFTGIPLTHRGLSSSVTFMTGHSKKNLEIPTSGTMVFYMGGSNLTTIATEAIHKGWPSDTPALLVYNVSNCDQEEHYSTLQQIIDDQSSYKTPVIIIIGEVVRLKTHSAASIEKSIFLGTGRESANDQMNSKGVYFPFIENKELILTSDSF